MNAIEGAFRRVIADLGALGQRWALVGGFAVSARAEPRFTRDIDIAVTVTGDSAAEAVVRELMGRGYQLFASVEHDATSRLATARLVLSADSSQEIVVDLLFASSGIESEIVAAAEGLEILPDLAIPVARVGHLLAIKLLARDDLTRPQDLADIRSLLVVATSDDLELARRAVDLITERGFDRGRDLSAALANLAEVEPNR